MRLLVALALILIPDTVNPDSRNYAGSKELYPAKRFIACNVNLYDSESLKRFTLVTKYIFIGRVYDVKSVNSTRAYKVNIRRVLKGDLEDVGAVKFETVRSLRFSDATVLVESPASFCRPLRLRMYAIFLTEKKRDEGALWLSLVVGPVPLTLRNIEVIEATVKVPRARIVSNDQVEALLGLLEANEEIARGCMMGGALASQRVQECWQNAAAMLGYGTDESTDESVVVGPRRSRTAAQDRNPRPYRRRRYDDPPVWAQRYEEQRFQIYRDRVRLLERLVEIAEQALELCHVHSSVSILSQYQRDTIGMKRSGKSRDTSCSIYCFNL